MPNWVNVRVYLSGPAEELERFRRSCIRSHAELDEGEVGLDFEALVPTPPEVAVTIKDKSEEAKRVTLATHGVEDWYEWRVRYWGCKWNASGFLENSASPEVLDFVFDTPWSFPRPVFAALARRFPQLTGQVFATELCGEWGAVGHLAGGRFQQAEVEITRELQYLVEMRTASPSLRRAMADGITKVFAREPAIAPPPVLSGMSEEQIRAALDGQLAAEKRILLRSALLTFFTAEPDGVEPWRRDLSMEALWDAIQGELPALHQRHLAFAFGVKRYLDYDDEDSPWFYSQFNRDGELLPLEAVVQCGDTRRFIEADGRSYSKIDRALISALACHVKATVGSTEPLSELDQAFRCEAGNIVIHWTEDQLYEWAAHAVFRPGVRLDLSTLETLQRGFVEYASLLYHCAIGFLARSAVLERGAA